MTRILSLDVADLAGISYRQTDHWVRKGYIKARPRHDGHEEYGSGVAREFDESEVAVAVEMAALVRAGFTPKAAAPLARELCSGTALFSGHPAVGLGGAYVLVRFPEPSPLQKLSAPAGSVGDMGDK